MKTRTGLASLILAAVLAAAPPVFGQPMNPTAPQQNPMARDAQSMKELNEQLERRVEQYVSWLARMYQLTGDQQAQVKIRLSALKEEHLRFGPQIAQEVQGLQEEIRYYIAQGRRGEKLDQEKLRDLQNRLMQLVAKAPLNWGNVIKETEQLLPDEQVAQGRERQKEYRDRLQDWQKREASRQGPPTPMETDVLKPYLSPIVPDVLDEPPTPKTTAQPPPPGLRPSAQDQAASRAPRPPVPARPVVITPIEVDDWTKYVEEFVTTYKLDGGQQAQARRILGELKRRAQEYQVGHRADYDAVEKISEPNLRSEELEQLDKPLRDTFTELQTRLSDIPTQAQRKAAEAAKPVGPATATAPATQATRPTATAPATRPTATARSGQAAAATQLSDD